MAMRVALHEANPTIDFDGRGEPHPHFDAYWQEPERVPFLIEADGEVMGFCLIRVQADCWSVAEFSIIPPVRRGGIGRAAVDAVADRAGAAAGYLEAKVHPNSREVLPFWLAVGFSEVEGPGTGVTITRRTL